MGIAALNLRRLNQILMLHSEKHNDPVALLMESLNINANGPTQRPRNGPDRSRISSLDPEHSVIVGNCLVFRISLGRHVLSNSSKREYITNCYDL